MLKFDAAWNKGYEDYTNGVRYADNWAQHPTPWQQSYKHGYETARDNAAEDLYNAERDCIRDYDAAHGGE